MQTGPKNTPNSVIPLEYIPEIFRKISKKLKLLQKELKDAFEFPAFLSIEHEEKTWQIMLARKEGVSGKKVKKSDFDYYAIDDSQSLGKGSQGEVLVAENIETQVFAAVKVQRNNSPSFTDDLAIERRNLAMRQRLLATAEVIDADFVPDQNPDVAEAQQMKATTYYTLMPYCPGQNLIDYLYVLDAAHKKNSPAYFAQKKPVDILVATRMIMGAIAEVIDLHMGGLLHRDIKSDNFVIKSNAYQPFSSLTLIDLGTAILRGTEKRKEDASTFGYFPPEYLVDVGDRPDWDENCDIWQLGMVIAEILTSENYQAALKADMKEQKATSVKKHLTLEQIHNLMPDIFAKSKPQSEIKTGKKEEKHQDPAQALRKLLITYVHELMNEDRDSRPKLARLQAMQSALRAEYLRVDALLLAADPSYRYQMFKRQKTLLNLQPNTNASSSAPLPLLNDDAMIIPTKTHSVSIEEPDVSEEKKPSKRSSLFPRRKSLGRLDNKIESTSAQMEDKKEEMPTDIVKRARSSSSSAKVHKKSQQVTNVLATATLDEASLTATIASLSLDESSTQKTPLTELTERLEREKVFLGLLSSQLSTTVSTEGDQPLKVASDTNARTCLFLVKTLEGVINEKDAHLQQSKIDSLMKLTGRWKATKIVELNQEVDTIKTALNAYVQKRASSSL
ncbi:protein kinase domain-containing protein [Candidatus Berkiella aquae]|uniref:Protein kinase n=1 Tax=Candidatus Berkiella aquae TaxID=295108 RepID=A0A0Q9YC33_9GAMM|nr:protein kinase [Candidatus Berkiella aquae]MCS5711049.1 protein kinase [Candidatus Berkiella aquae]